MPTPKQSKVKWNKASVGPAIKCYSYLYKSSWSTHLSVGIAGQRKKGKVLGAIWSQSISDCKLLNFEFFCIEGVCEFAPASLDLGGGRSVQVLAVYRPAPPSNIYDQYRLLSILHAE